MNPNGRELLYPNGCNASMGGFSSVIEHAIGRLRGQLFFIITENSDLSRCPGEAVLITVWGRGQK